MPTAGIHDRVQWTVNGEEFEAGAGDVFVITTWEGPRLYFERERLSILFLLAGAGENTSQTVIAFMARVFEHPFAGFLEKEHERPRA